MLERARRLAVDPRSLIRTRWRGRTTENRRSGARARNRIGPLRSRWIERRGARAGVMLFSPRAYLSAMVHQRPAPWLRRCRTTRIRTAYRASTDRSIYPGVHVPYLRTNLWKNAAHDRTGTRAVELFDWQPVQVATADTPSTLAIRSRYRSRFPSNPRTIRRICSSVPSGRSL